jgi:DNA-binding Lrp family transcriptional regulator
VQEAYALTGDADYLVRLAVPDLQALSRVLNEVFLPHESVAHVRSSIVLEHLKQSARLPLGHLVQAIATSPGSQRAAKRPSRRRSQAR